MAHKEAPQPVQLGGEPLDRILHATRPTLVSRVLAELQAQIPAYQKLPAEQLAGDIAQVTAHNMELIARMMRTGQPPSADELATIRESAARRAEEGIPIELVQTAYHVGALAVWDAITRDVRPEDATNVAAAARLVVRYLQSVTPEVAAGYLEERQVISGDEQLTRHALFAALLEGGDLADAAERAGVPLPAAYLVLSVNVGAHPDESTPGVDATVAGRRKLRRLRTELQRQVREPVLASLATDHGTALLPAAPPVDWDWVRQAVASAGRAAGAEITVGAEVAAPPGVADAARIAREVLEVAAML
ncbi:MAG: hypothetical protein ACRDT4_15700, partial [Micromonosporaceae bacterium]